MTVHEHEQTLEAWNAIAPGYDAFVTPTHVALGEEALRRARLRPGMRFLDVAAGSGALALPAARLGADVVAVDMSPVMIERLEARARAEGLSNLACRVMDGHALDLDDDGFDLAGSQFGVMLFPDLPRGVRELARVTRPGGRVLVVAFGPPREVEFLTVMLGAVEAVAPGAAAIPSTPPPLPFQAADPDVLRGHLVGAGLEDVRIERTVEELAFRTGPEMWDWVVNSNPVGAALVAGLAPEERTAVRAELDRALRERSGGDGPGILTSRIHIAVGTTGAARPG